MPSCGARHFAFNRNALTLFRGHGRKPAMPPRAANHATQTRRVVFFCAVRTPACICGTH
jgi:hypothetical protein